MKTLKTLVILLACAGSIGAMDHAAESGARAPLVDHDVCITTVGGEVCFTPEQLMKLDFLYGMLEEEAPVERGKDIDLREICAERPCLRYEGLHHIPALVDCVTRADIDHYLSEISPEQACCAVLALHFLSAPQNVFIWAHAYIINRLVNDNLFAINCLSLSEVRKNLEHIIEFCNNDSAPASIGLLRTMLLENGLSTSISCICFGASNFQLSPDDSRLAVEQEIDGELHVVLHQTSDGNEIGSPILGRNPVFNSDGSKLVVRREIDGNMYVVLHRTIDGNEIGSPILGYNPVFSSDGSRLAVDRIIDDELHVVLHQTSDYRQIGSPILGYYPIFSPDGSKLVVRRKIDGNMYVVLHRTIDGNEIGSPILGRNPVFNSDGSRLTVRREIDRKTHVVLYRASDSSEIGSPILGDNPRFNPDGSLLKITSGIDGNNRSGLYPTDGGNTLLQNVGDAQFGTNGTIAYQDGDRITCINPININSAEYLLTLAAIHLGHELIETAWRNIFDQAPDELKTFVRAKTGKFIS